MSASERFHRLLRRGRRPLAFVEFFGAAILLVLAALEVIWADEGVAALLGSLILMVDGWTVLAEVVDEEHGD